MVKRVLVAEFMHETNTFSVQLTDEAAFRNAGASISATNCRPPSGYAHIDGRGVRGRGEIRLAAGASVRRPANPSGRVTDEAFEASPPFLAACDGIDGVLLHLHGAMATELG